MYRIVSDDTVLLIGENKFIPFDNNNRDYMIYLEWVAQGNTPEPPETNPAISAVSTPMEQAVILLLKMSSPATAEDITLKDELISQLESKTL